MKKIPNDRLGRPTAAEYAAREKMPVTVVLDNIRSLNNVGSFFRTADAFAIERIMLCGVTGTPPDREIHKTALGAELTVEWSYSEQAVSAIEQLRTQGYTVVAIEQVEGGITLDEFTPAQGQRYALVFGNEVFGVSEEALELCHAAIEIPQAGTKHSLNVAVCGGVVLWHFFRNWYADVTRL